MRSIDIILWVLFGFFTAIYWWVGKIYISQPRFKHPRIFWNPISAKALVLTPQIGFLLCVISGFVYTSNGWWYLSAFIVSFVVLAPRPSAF